MRDMDYGFAVKLKALREQSKLNQAELGEALGVSRGSISFYENGERTPDIGFLKRVSAHFNVSADYLLGVDKRTCDDPDFLTELEHLFCDVNVNEIAGQIQLDSLSRWCASWRKKSTELTAALKGE